MIWIFQDKKKLKIEDIHIYALVNYKFLQIRLPIRSHAICSALPSIKYSQVDEFAAISLFHWFS